MLIKIVAKIINDKNSKRDAWYIYENCKLQKLKREFLIFNKISSQLIYVL